MYPLLRDCFADGVTVELRQGRLLIHGDLAGIEKWRARLQANKAALFACLSDARAHIRAARLTLMAERGLTGLEADKTANRLEVRDLQDDERRLCLECAHLSGSAGARRCAQWRRTGMPGPQIPPDLPLLLQRCRGFCNAVKVFGDSQV
jgi:hypothetical protein